MRKSVRAKCGVVLLVMLMAIASTVSPARVSAASIDVVYDGSVVLSPSGTFEVKAYNPDGGTYTVNETTPLGALQAAVSTKGLTYDVTDKNFGTSGALLLDNIGSYAYVKGGGRWYAYVNGAFQDGFNNPSGGLNLIQRQNGDTVEFYFAEGISDAADLATVKTKATAAVKTVASIEASSSPGDDDDLPTAASGSWNLTLTGKITDVFTQAEFEEGIACARSGHKAEWTDKDGNVWSGMPLWFLAGWVDDEQPHDYNFAAAEAGYTILVKAEDGYTREFSSQDVAKNNKYIVADKLNGESLENHWPLRLVGEGVAKDDGGLSGASVGNIAEIELINFENTLPVPELHIIKYAADQTTIANEMTIDYRWMENNLPVVGDGVTKYRYEGITNNPDDVWDQAETYPGGFKLENAVKGSRVSDLCDLVGGMGSGTEVVLIAKDGYETRLPYSSIYPDPAVKARQGDAILAWWGDGNYVPDYVDGMRLFFTPDGDHVYGQWDMHETLPEKYWHYYYSDMVQYPSCAGLSTKYITQIKVYTVPAGDWTLQLDGEDIGGLKEDINKTYFEQALACQFGADHKAVYEDSKGRVWEGIPLWFLAGFVDDADKHSSDAFDAELAEAGYTLVITATDGHSVTVASEDIIRNNNYIIANIQDGAAIAESDKNWPLRLVGPSVTGSDSIGQITGIKLLKSEGLRDIQGHWAQEDIERLVALEAVTGYPDRSFKPDAPITRAEFVTVMAKAFGLVPEEGDAFDDTVGHWAEDFISAAASSGIVQGYGDGSFGPDDKVTREQIAVMVVRTLDLELIDGETAFADNDSISEWAKEAIVAAAKDAILLGYPDNTFRPQVNATRAEAVTVIVKALGD